MRKSLLGLAIAGALAFGIASTPGIARADDLSVITQDNLDTDVINSPKISVLVVVGKNCKSCAGVVDAAAKSGAQYPEIQVNKVDQDVLVVDDEDLPELRVYVPGQGYIGTKKNVDAVTVDAFIKARADYAAKRAIAQDAVKAQQAVLDTNKKPFQARAEDLLKRAEAALGAEYKALQDADKAVRNAKTSIEAESLKRKADGLRATFNANAKPYLDEFKALDGEAEAALAADQKNVDEAGKVVEKLDADERNNILP